MSNVVGVILCVALLLLWLGARREDRIAVQRTCRHHWVVESLCDEGRLWYRRCERCDKQEPVPPPQAGTSRARPPRRPPYHRGPGR
jgi:hypothetical protein